MKKALNLLIILAVLFVTLGSAYAETVNLWFPPGWKAKGAKARVISKALAEQSGINIKPRIAKSYPEILKAFDSGQPSLVYVGSFVQAIIKARGLGTPLVQSINGKELYSGIMVYPKGEDPEAILKNTPEQIAFTIGASSGESSAKAATSGKASIGVANHGAASGAVKAGKAKAAVVKNWWWEANKAKFPTLATYKVPGVSIEKNPDNVLTASKSLGTDTVSKVKSAALQLKDAFGATGVEEFDASKIDFSIELMKKGNIDPLTYSW